MTVFQIPGFSDLSLNDQMKLLQASWTEVGTKKRKFKLKKKDRNKHPTECRYYVIPRFLHSIFF